MLGGSKKVCWTRTPEVGSRANDLVSLAHHTHYSAPSPGIGDWDGGNAAWDCSVESLMMGWLLVSSRSRLEKPNPTRVGIGLKRRADRSTQMRDGMFELLY